jgi:hypothetical protein
MWYVATSLKGEVFACTFFQLQLLIGCGKAASVKMTALGRDRQLFQHSCMLCASFRAISND